MTDWISIVETIKQLREAPEIPPDTPARVRAAMMVMTTFGSEIADEIPALINVAALSTVMDRVTVHEIGAEVASRVASTDLHTLPGEVPVLLKRPWIFQAKRHDRPLFGDTSEIAGYQLEPDGPYWLVALRYPDGISVVHWTPQWREEGIPESIGEWSDPDVNPLLETDTTGDYSEWAIDAVRFCVVLAIMIEAANTPITLGDEIPHLWSGKRIKKGKTEKKARSEGSWAVRRIYLDRPKKSGGGGGSTEGEGGRVDGRIPHTAEVTGHLKRQPYGPGLAKRKWIYVQSYEARRWIAPKPLKIIVNR